MIALLGPLDDFAMVYGYWWALITVPCLVVWACQELGRWWRGRHPRRVRRAPMIDFTAVPPRDPAVWATRAEYDRDERAA